MIKQSTNGRNYFVFYSFLWILWSGLHTFITYNYGISLFSASIDSLVSNISLFLLCIVISNILKFYQPGLNRSGYLLIWCIVLAGVWFAFIRASIPFVLGNDNDFMALFNASLILRSVLAFLLMGGSVLMMWVWQNFKNNSKENERFLQMLELSKEAELNSLKQQLQPHFLFNSLNSISALAVSNPIKAREMIEQLSDFLRMTLRKNETKFQQFSEELRILILYLDIEKLRFGYRLKTEFTIDEACNNDLIPSLIIQPVLENAIKFGLYGTIQEVNININATHSDNLLEIVITNPFDPDESDRNSGEGFGLYTIKRRLFLMYNRNDLLHTSTKGNLFITTIKIPQNS